MADMKYELVWDIGRADHSESYQSRTEAERRCHELRDTYDYQVFLTLFDGDTVIYQHRPS